ncbi:MFS transporter [Brevibacillus fluminis]|uniref:MFS transporter n=1 Tax=Brevibacillus fluminis TaxID=511487 RepID=A0A3M8DQV8_9BACL|nr:MFS transporter [Brevibacillus fluminis]RNB90462.1 MFS transporter [Brevibacillus fluminis]
MNPRVYILAIASFVVGTVELIIGGTLDMIARDLSVSLSAAGQLITVFSLSFAITAPILLHLTRQVERKKLYLACLSVFFLSNVFAALSPSYLVLLLARIVAASSGSLLVILSITIAAGIVQPAYRGRAIGVIFMGISGSLVLGVPLGMMLGNLYGWRAPFWLIAALSIVAMVCLGLFLPKVSTPDPVPLKQQLAALKNVKIISAHFTPFFMLTGHLTLYAYFTPFLQQTMGLSAGWLSITYFLFGIAAVMGGGIGGWLSDKWGATRSIITIISLFAVIMAFLPLATHSFALFMVVMVLWSSLSWAISPAQQHYLIHCAPETADIQMGLNTSVLHIGVAGGSLIGGFVAERASVFYNAWVGAAIVVLSLVCAIFSITRPLVGQKVPLTDNSSA